MTYYPSWGYYPSKFFSEEIRFSREESTILSVRPSLTLFLLQSITNYTEPKKWISGWPIFGKRNKKDLQTLQADTMMKWKNMTFFLRKIYYYFRSVHPLPKRTQYARGTHDNVMVVNFMFFFIFAFFFFISWFLHTWQWLKNDIFITAKITNSMSKVSRLLFLFFENFEMYNVHATTSKRALHHAKMLRS